MASPLIACCRAPLASLPFPEQVIDSHCSAISDTNLVLIVDHAMASLDDREACVAARGASIICSLAKQCIGDEADEAVSARIQAHLIAAMPTHIPRLIQRGDQ